MQEMLSKTDDPKTPLHDQEFYELRLYDSESAGNPVYCVREAHGSMSRCQLKVGSGGQVDVTMPPSGWRSQTG